MSSCSFENCCVCVNVDCIIFLSFPSGEVHIRWDFAIGVKIKFVTIIVRSRFPFVLYIKFDSQFLRPIFEFIFNLFFSNKSWFTLFLICKKLIWFENKLFSLVRKRSNPRDFFQNFYNYFRFIFRRSLIVSYIILKWAINVIWRQNLDLPVFFWWSFMFVFQREMKFVF